MLKYSYIIKIVILLLLSIFLVVLGISKVPDTHIHEFFKACHNPNIITNVARMRMKICSSKPYILSMDPSSKIKSMYTQEYLKSHKIKIKSKYTQEYLKSHKIKIKSKASDKSIYTHEYLTSHKIIQYSPPPHEKAKDHVNIIDCFQIKLDTHTYNISINSNKNPIIFKHKNNEKDTSEMIKKIMCVGYLSNVNSTLLLVTHNNPTTPTSTLKYEAKTHNEFTDSPALQKHPKKDILNKMYQNTKVVIETLNEPKTKLIHLIATESKDYNEVIKNLNRYPHNIYPKVRDKKGLKLVTNSTIKTSSDAFTNSVSKVKTHSLLFISLFKYKWNEQLDLDAGYVKDYLKAFKKRFQNSGIDPTLLNSYRDQVLHSNNNTRSIPDKYNFDDIQILSIKVYTNYIYHDDTFYKIIYSPVIEVKFIYNKLNKFKYKDTYIKIYYDKPSTNTNDSINKKKYNHFNKIPLSLSKEKLTANYITNHATNKYDLYFDVDITVKNTYTLRLCYKNENNTIINVPFLSFTDQPKETS